MAAGWNDTFDETTDWSDIAFYKMFFEATNERLTARNVVASQLVTVPEAGDDVQYGGGVVPAWRTPTSITRSGSTATINGVPSGHSLLANHMVRVKGCDQPEYNGVFRITSVTANTISYAVSGSPATPATGTIEWRSAMFSIRELHTRIEGTMAFGFVRGAWSGGGSTAPGSYSLATALADAGSPDTTWRRKRPREVTLNSFGLTAGTTDSQGNTIAVGMKAINLSATFGLRSRVYECTAVGASTTWALNTTHPPDTLDSHAAAPDTVGGGTHLSGDYIGPWLFTEVRDVLNLYLVVVGPSVLASISRAANGGETTSSPPVSWATAKASAESNFTTATPSAIEFGSRYTGTHSSWFGSDTYHAVISAQANTQGLGARIQSLVGEANWYVKAEAHALANSVFDDQGLGYTEGIYTLVYGPLTVTGMGDTVVQDAQVFGETTIPTAVDEPTSGTSPRTRGYRVQSVVCTIDFTVSGGFAYKP
jgi:hypothetical protein